MVAIALLTVSSALAAAPEKPERVAQAKSSEATNFFDGPIGAGIPIFDLSKLDHVPVVKFQAPAEYPAAMHRASIEGEVLVDFVVNSEGKVVNAFAARSSHPEFEAAAVTAVRKWKFQAGVKGGRAVNTHMQVPIAFALE